MMSNRERRNGMAMLMSDETIQLAKEWRIKSAIIYRDGELLEDWHDGGSDSLGPLYSITKSVLSALIGIALDRGEIGSIDQPIGDYLDVSELDEQLRRSITIKHLLTMTPGFEWPDFDKPYKEMRASADPVAYTLAKPVIHEPGHAYTYNSGGSHLLSAILTAATGKSAVHYAKERLFQPLGFEAARWSEKNGISEGGTGLSLYGHDLAKIGMMYVQGGRWNGAEIVSPSWIEQSTALHHRGLLHYEPPIYGGYGYHWWISPEPFNGCADCYFAFGHGGQHLMNIPSLGLTIVIRKKITKRNDAKWARELIFQHLVPMALK